MSFDFEPFLLYTYWFDNVVSFLYFNRLDRILRLITNYIISRLMIPTRQQTWIRYKGFILHYQKSMD